MPDVGSTTNRRVLVGGEGRVLFAVPLDQVGRIETCQELPQEPRTVNLPRLFGMPTTPAAEDRFARVLGLAEPSYLRLGARARVEEIPAPTRDWLPAILNTTAARWCWVEVVPADESTIIVVDPVRLVRLGAKRRLDVSTEPSPSRAEAR